MNKMVSMPSETKLTETSPKNIFLGKDLMGKSFPFLDVKSVLNLLCVNKVVRMDMKAFLEDFRRPYASLSTSIPASNEAFLGIIDTLEKSVRDLGYRSDKVTLRLLPSPPNLTSGQPQSLTTILYLSQNPANRQPLVAAGVHMPLSVLLGDLQASPRVKEFAAAALMNLLRELDHLLLDLDAPPWAKEYAAQALCNLSADPANLRALVAAGVHISLKELLDADEQATTKAKEYAAEALCNISADPATCLPLVAAGVDFQFMELLQNGTASPRAIEYAQQGLQNCCEVPFN